MKMTKDHNAMRFFRSLIVAICCIAPAMSSADMYVDKSIVTFTPGSQPRQDIRVSNSSEDVMYVQVDAFYDVQADGERICVAGETYNGANFDALIGLNECPVNLSKVRAENAQRAAHIDTGGAAGF